MAKSGLQGYPEHQNIKNQVKDLDDEEYDNEEEEEKTCDVPPHQAGLWQSQAYLWAGYPPRPTPRQDIVGRTGDEDDDKMALEKFQQKKIAKKICQKYLVHKYSAKKYSLEKYFAMSMRANQLLKYSTKKNSAERYFVMKYSAIFLASQDALEVMGVTHCVSH